MGEYNWKKIGNSIAAKKRVKKLVESGLKVIVRHGLEDLHLSSITKKGNTFIIGNVDYQYEEEFSETTHKDLDLYFLDPRPKKAKKVVRKQPSWTSKNCI